MIPESYIKNLCISKFVLFDNNTISQPLNNITFEGPFKVIIRQIFFYPLNLSNAPTDGYFKIFCYNSNSYVTSFNTTSDYVFYPKSEILISNATMFNSLDFRVDRFNDLDGTLDNTGFKGTIDIYVDIVKYKN